MSENKSCCCSAAPKLVFARSGGADVGALADQAARKLTADGVAKMFCLAGIGGRVAPVQPCRFSSVSSRRASLWE